MNWNLEITFKSIDTVAYDMIKLVAYRLNIISYFSNRDILLSLVIYDFNHTHQPRGKLLNTPEVSFLSCFVYFICYIHHLSNDKQLFKCCFTSTCCFIYKRDLHGIISNMDNLSYDSNWNLFCFKEIVETYLALFGIKIISALLKLYLQDIFRPADVKVLFQFYL